MNRTLQKSGVNGDDQAHSTRNEGVKRGKRETDKDASGEGVGGAAGRERVEGYFGGGVLGLAKGGAVVRGLKGLSIEVNDGFESRRVIRTFPYTSVRRQIEAAPLRQLL